MSALLVDIGNSRIKWRTARLDEGDTVIDGDAFPRWTSAEGAIAIADVDGIDTRFRASLAQPTAPALVDIAFVANVASEAVGRSIADAVTTVWPTAAVRAVRPEAVTCGLSNGYRNPRQLGVDRWLASVAARALFPGRSLLVCTFGTATTIDLVLKDRFVGGLILPGIDAMSNALTSSTARLPASTGDVVDFADRTEDAITSGVMAAQIGAVEHAVAALRRRPDTAGSAPLCVVAGGAASRMAASFDALDTPHEIVHDLVLRGLAYAGRATLAAVPG